ncbi:MAG: inositol monophosphatase family protein [Candidatus Neomarinimicrobiota bacterium]
MTPTKKELLHVALTAARKAAEFIRQESHKVHRVDFKGTSDLVTRVDRGSEQIILDQLERHFPDHGILTEESDGKAGESAYRWIVDPLDGTTNFVHRYPFYAVSIAVHFEDTPIVGVIADVYHRQTYWATEGGGAFRDGESMAVSRTRKLEHAILSTGFPYVHDEVWARNFDYLRVLKDKSQGVRRGGAAAIDLAFVSCGWLDGFWEFGLKPWDQAAGALMVQEAGGRVSRANGPEFSVFDPEIVATNGYLHEEILRAMKSVTAEAKVRKRK